MAESKKPKIRFKGFVDDWELHKLGDVAEIVGGGTPSTSNPKYWDGDIDWYSPTEIGDHVYANESVKTITQLGLEKSSAKILPPDKTVLFTSRAGIGDMAILRHPGATNQGFQSLVLKEGIDTYFIYSMGHLIKKYAEKNASGSTFLEISGKTLGNMPILLPLTNEQTQIGTFFKTLDNLITLQQCEYDKLINVKKSMLEKMFPKDGKDIPEIRFKRFADAWEQRKLDDAAVFIDGNYGEKYPNEDEFIEIGVPFFTSAVIGTSGIFNRDSVKFISEKKNAILVKAQSEGGDLILTNRGASMGTIAQIPTDYDLVNIGPQLTRIRGNEKADNLFLLAMFKTSKNNQKLLSINTGSAMNFVGLETLGKFTFYAPDIKEQIKIGLFFKNLDNLITLHQCELEKLKNIKKSCLEQMFV